MSQLARANNIAAPYTLSVGQRLVVPGASSPVSPQPTVQTASAPVNAPSQRLSGGQQGGAHVVRAGETMYSLGRTYNVHPNAIANASSLETWTASTICGFPALSFR